MQGWLGALLAWAATAAAADPLACAPAATVPVYDCAWTGSQVRCPAFPSRFRPGPGVARLALAGAVSGRDLAAGGRRCVQLLAFQRDPASRCKEALYFRNFTVGWVTLAPGTANKQCRDCVRELRITEDVAGLRQFMYRSNEDKFWDFSDPVFDAQTGSLVQIVFNEIDKSIPCRISLANVQYLGNTSLESFQLNRNGNSSTELKLGFMPKMRDFRIRYTYLGKFPKDAGARMPALETLSLQGAGLRAVPALADMGQLQTLELGGCRLGRLAGRLPPLPGLLNLALDDAGLCCLADDRPAFEGLPRLQFLSVANNSLTTIGSALTPLHNLEELYAWNNLLVEYPQLDTRTPAILVFDHNRLQTLPHCDHFGHNATVLSLDISYNQIASWDDHPEILRCVQSVNLSYNAVSAASPAMLRALDRVRAADLGGNPLQCRGCPLARLQRWLLDTRVRCWRPPPPSPTATASSWPTAPTCSACGCARAPGAPLPQTPPPSSTTLSSSTAAATGSG